MSTTVFRNASVIDGSGRAPFDADVVVTDARIASVASAGDRALPEGARVVDCAGATLMPGLIEPHAHLSFVDQATPQQFSTLPIEEHLLLTLKHVKPLSR
jgi:imidazolonepropionase-like amidohydrolase